MWPNRAAVSRYKSIRGRNRAGSPPMIATISGSPSAPARAKDFGRAADTDPDRQRGLYGPWDRRLDRSARPVRAGPVDVLGLANVQQQIKLLVEEPVVVASDRPNSGKAR